MTRFAPASIIAILAGAILFATVRGGPHPADFAAAAGPSPADRSAVFRPLSSLDPALAAGAPRQVLVIGRASAPGKAGASPVAGLDAPGRVRELAGRRGVAGARVTALAGSRAAREAFPGGAWVLRYDGDEPPASVAARLREDPAVLYAGPNHLLGITVESGDAAAPGAMTSGHGSPSAIAPANGDSLRAEQYALDMVGADAAWTLSRGSGVLVAVIDTGVDVTHPDLAAGIHVNLAERDGIAGVDDDGNGYVDDVTGYDFTDAPELPGVGDHLDPDPDPADEYGHGTMVAGVIAAAEGNGIGTAGLAPDARILPLRAGFNTGLPFLPALLQEDDAAEAILYAVDNGADILNLSWGDLVEAPLLEMVVRYARSHGVLVVAGAGNDPGDLAFWPAAYAGIVSAGACDRTGARAGFSTFGQDLDLLAPGVELWTTIPGGGYQAVTGTSFSSPMTAAAAALVWSRHPGWTADQVAWHLRLTAQREAAGWTPGRGWGILDAAAAVSDDQAPPVVQVESVRGREAPFGKPGPSAARDVSTAVSPAAEPLSAAADPALTPTAFSEYTVTGTAAVSTLNRWTLSMLPESVAVNAGPAGPESEVPAERVLVRDARRQVVAESLAVFTPGPAGAGPWIARLRAWAGGQPVLEKRLRFTVVPPEFDLRDLSLELQVARGRGGDPNEAGGWDLVATWTSETPYRGSFSVDWPDEPWNSLLFAEETSVGTHHAVRLEGPLPVGQARIEIHGRGGAEEKSQALALRDLEIPAATVRFLHATADGWPAGTPMRRSEDWNGDGRHEFFIEAAPVGGALYGPVARYERAPADGEPPVLLDSSEGVHRGIPVDIADADGDGLLELVVFRLDGWSIYEEDAAGEVPVREVFHEGPGTPVPVSFAATSAGTVLVAISGGGLAVYAPDAQMNWGFASDAPASDISLQHGGVIADLDGDGVTDAFFADAYGRLFRFTIDGATVRYQGQKPVPLPLAGAMLAVPGEGGRLDLLTTEVDPQVPEAEGDTERAAVRVRRWAWDGSHLAQRDSLAFGGLIAAGEIRLLPWLTRAVLLRGTRTDVIGLADGGLEAGGGLPVPSSLSRVDGAALAAVDDQGFKGGPASILWRGNSRSEEPGESVLMARTLTGPAVGNPPLRVAWARVEGDSLLLSLRWDSDACPALESLRKTTEDGSQTLTLESDRHAYDRLALGERATYAPLFPPDLCATRSLEVFAAPPQEPVPAWDGPERLVLTFDPPLRELPQMTLLRRVRDYALPTGVSLDRHGARLLVAVSGDPPTEISLRGAWDTHGLPIGGNELTWRVAVPEAPQAAAQPVLALVDYAGRDAPHLEVTVSGGAWAPSCDLPFRLEPPGWDLAAQPAPGGAGAAEPVGSRGEPAGRGTGLRPASLPGATSQVFAVPLPERLPPGPYTLTLRPDCLGPEERGPGQELAFHVGVRVFPNPLRTGGRLTVDNAEVGSRVLLVDVVGREVLDWRVGAVAEKKEIPELAPGLYFLRLESPEGRFLSHHKLVILR